MFASKVLLSFFVGGLYVTAVTVIAEKMNPRVAGVFAGLPSTALIIVAFLAATSSSKDAAKASVITPAAVGAAFIFMIAYVKVGVRGISYGLVTGYAIWALIALPLAAFHLSNIWISVGICAVCFLLCEAYLASVPAGEPKPLPLTAMNLLSRTIASGLVVAFAVVLGKAAGPVWGVAFTGFPAAVASWLVIIHRRHGLPFTVAVAKKWPYGALGTASFGAFFHFLGARWTFAPAFFSSYLLCAVVAVGLSRIRDRDIPAVAITD